MVRKAYFIFPEHEDQFYELGDDPETYKHLINDVAILRQFVRANQTFELWYDSKNVVAFLNRVENFIGGEYLGRIRTQLQRIFSRDVNDVQSSTLICTTCVYMRLMSDFSFQDTPFALKDAVENSVDTTLIQPIVISIGGAVKDDERDTLNIVKDALHINDMPALFRIPFFREEMALREWTVNHIGVGTFTLRDKTIFRLTGKRWKQQAIYYHAATAQYWYYDFFHKDNKQHFEVFDSLGDHIGEADLNGDLMPTTADPNKKISKII